MNKKRNYNEHTESSNQVWITIQGLIKYLLLPLIIGVLIYDYERNSVIDKELMTSYKDTIKTIENYHEGMLLKQLNIHHQVVEGSSILANIIKRQNKIFTAEDENDLKAFVNLMDKFTSGKFFVESRKSIQKQNLFIRTMNKNINDIKLYSNKSIDDFEKAIKKYRDLNAKLQENITTQIYSMVENQSSILKIMDENIDITSRESRKKIAISINQVKNDLTKALESKKTYEIELNKAYLNLINLFYQDMHSKINQHIFSKISKSITRTAGEIKFNTMYGNVKPL